jgi:hypothetical protein
MMQMAYLARMAASRNSSVVGTIEERDVVPSPKASKSRLELKTRMDVFRENNLLKASLQRLTLKNDQQRHEISLLQTQLHDVNCRLSEEKAISDRLEGIRDILKRKMALQDARINFLEKEKITADQLSATHATSEYGKCDGVVIDPQECLEHTDHSSSSSAENPEHFHKDPLSLLEESSTDSTFFLFDEDNGSCSSPRVVWNDHVDSKQSPRDLTTQASVKSARNKSLTSTSVGELCLESTSEYYSSCECQQSFLSSGNLERIEFFLPSLNVSCLCGKKQCQTINSADMRLDALLRPWQSDFLASVGIVDVAHFIQTQNEDAERLTQEIVRWRRDKALEPMPPKACGVALLIWARACAAVSRRVETKLSR